MNNPTDFSKDDRWRTIIQERTPEGIKALATWLRENPNAFVTLYHGTAQSHPVMTQGLLPTTMNRRNSLQSRSGFVSLSIFQENAERFAKLGYPNQAIEVYAATLCVRSLVTDTDQLRNQRLFAGLDLKNTLANSLVFGHGAQVKGVSNPDTFARSAC